VVAQAGDALLEALSSLFAQIAREPPLPDISSRSCKIRHILDETASERLREEEALQVAAGEAAVEAALAHEMSQTLSEIDALRRGSTT
jgi:hypothetical protein